MACAGASDEMCGGYDRMSVWSFTTTPVTGTDFTCDGVQSGDFCCSSGCTICGGKGCGSSANGPGDAHCCQDGITESGYLCSVTGRAPCLIDEQTEG
ncbi:unnamed protein product [Ectocarpus fasciculatus]